MANRKRSTRKRDYKAEYQWRVERGKAKGYSRSVARGHPPKGVAGIRGSRVLGIRPGASLDALIERDAKRVFGRKPKREYGEAANEYEEKLTELQKRRGRFEWTDETEFINSLMSLGLTEQDAYTHWFSP